MESAPLFELVMDFHPRLEKDVAFRLCEVETPIWSHIVYVLHEVHSRDLCAKDSPAAKHLDARWNMRNGPTIFPVHYVNAQYIVAVDRKDPVLREHA